MQSIFTIFKSFKLILLNLSSKIFHSLNREMLYQINNSSKWINKQITRNRLTIFKNLSSINKMFSDIHSVRSDPLVSINSRAFNVAKQNIYFDSQFVSESRFRNSPQRWKNMLLPQIDVKYQEIIKQREGTTRRIDLENQKSRVSVASCTSKLNPRLSNSRNMDLKTMQTVYEQKIQTLEQQNENLRQELFYLREALLLNFETKEKIKEKQQKTPPKSTE